MAEAAIETIGLISGIMGIVDFTEGLVPDKPAEGTVVRIKAGLGSALDDTGGWVRFSMIEALRDILRADTHFRAVKSALCTAMAGATSTLGRATTTSSGRVMTTPSRSIKIPLECRPVISAWRTITMVLASHGSPFRNMMAQTLVVHGLEMSAKSVDNVGTQVTSMLGP